MFVVTETWLASDDKHIVWAKVSELNKNNYRLIAVNMNKGRGGGLAIMYNSDLDVKLLSNSERNTFQFAIWKAETETEQLLMLNYIMYHHWTDLFIPTTSSQMILQTSMHHFWLKTRIS